MAKAKTNTKPKVEKFDRRILFDYLQEQYEITKMPKQMFMKLSHIFSGKLDGLTKPIPAEHMYDMWLRKQNYLNKVYMNNISKGNKMTGYCRLNYDLAIIISKYDDYLKWLSRQQTQHIEQEQLKENVQQTEVLYNNSLQQNNNHEENLADYIDELI